MRLRLPLLCRSALLALPLFWIPNAPADPPKAAPASVAAPVTQEVSKQAEIYQSRGENVPSGYVIGRTLQGYAYMLPGGFNDTLASLGPHDRWLDIGAGEGRAILDYCAVPSDTAAAAGGSDRKAQAVAISIEDRRTVHWHQTAASLDENRIRYLFGKPLSGYTLEELGQFQVITDVLGGFSYTQNLALFMQKALALLNVNGSFYTLLQDVRTEERKNLPHYPGAPFLTEIVDADGSELSVCAWLKRMSCVEVACEARNNTTPPTEVYHIRKTCNDVSVPSLVLVHFTAGTPPERRYRLNNTSPQASGAAY